MEENTHSHFEIYMEERAVSAISALGLAHVGDAVYELLVRSFLAGKGKLTTHSLHATTVKFVNAAAQAAAVEILLPLLTEEENAVLRRGRNARVNSVPKHARLADYHAATALEALFGWLYLLGRRERASALFDAIMEVQYAS